MKKSLKAFKKIFSVFIVSVAVIVMIFTIISVTTFNRNDRSIFGYKAFIVLSDSMKATDFAAGDIVFVKSVDPSTLEVGDIISYSSQNADNYGEIVTHKIRAKATDANGDPGFITYGTTNDVNDEIIVTYPYINGKYVFHIAKLGTIFNFLKTTPGYIICIFTPFLILILMQGLNTVKLFRRYKREQLEQIKAEREELENAKKQSEDMMEELKKLREQMEAMKQNNPHQEENDKNE